MLGGVITGSTALGATCTAAWIFTLSGKVRVIGATQLTKIVFFAVTIVTVYADAGLFELL
jgi:uncharacterized membrane protein YfcA